MTERAELPKQIGLTVKVTRDCNLRCKYCYMEPLGKTEATVMDTGTLENLISKFTEQVEKINFIWHGGEPLLPGLSFYQKVVELERKYGETNKCKIKNSMQTNATLAEDELIRFLTKEGFRMGISIDGPAEINDLVRLNDHGYGATAKIEAGIKKIQEYQRVGLLCVISKQNARVAEKVYQSIKDKGVKSIKFQPYEGTNPELVINNKEFFEFHRRIYDLWINDPRPLEKVLPISDFVKKFLGGDKVSYSAVGNCFRSNLDVDVNGDVYPCVLLGVDDYRLGNINSSSSEEIIFSKKRMTLFGKHKELQARCENSCEYFSLCQGGCMRINFSCGKKLFSKNHFCSGKKELFSYIADDLEKRLKPALISNNNLSN